jgi:hypothetical protein
MSPARIIFRAAFPLFASVAFLAGSTPVSAQLELAASGGIGNFSGDDFEGSEVGPTFGGELRFSVGPLAQLGLGFDYSSYGIEDTDENVDEIDVFLIARRYTDAPAMRFFYGGKAGYSRQSADSEFVTGTVSANGFAIGPTVGVQAPLGAIAFEAGVDVLYQSYGDFSVEGTEVEGSSASGFRWVTRLGLAVPLGG